MSVTTISSFDVTPGSIAPEPSGSAFQRVLAEDAFAYPSAYRFSPWDNDDAWYGRGLGHGATGTINDRRGGRDLPLQWSELDLRSFWLLARHLCDTNVFAIGFSSLLTNYNVRKGFGWQACKRGVRKTAYPTELAPSDPTISKAQAILDRFRDEQKWPIVSREAFRRWRRDGDLFGRLFYGGHGRLPVHRFVEPEQVGSPTGQTEGAASWGILNRPGDSQDVLAYFIRTIDGDGMEGEWVTECGKVDEDEVYRMTGKNFPVERGYIQHLKANVDSIVKRGRSDFLPVFEQLEEVRRLLRNMLVTAADLAAIAWREGFPTATAGQVQSLIPQVGADSNRVNDWYSGTRDSRGWNSSNRFKPNSVIRTEASRVFEPGPVAAGVPNFIQVVQACLRGCCVRWGLPEYASGDASNNNFASSLVAGSPFTVAVEGEQLLFGTWERSTALRVLDLAVDAGLLTREERHELDVEVTEPSVLTPKPLEDTQRWSMLNQAKVLSIPTWQLKEGLDPQHEAANFKAAEASPQQFDDPGNPGGGMGGGDDMPPDDPMGGGSPFGEEYVTEGLYELISEADRSHLVRKEITNSAGRKQVVYVNPNKKDKPARTGPTPQDRAKELKAQREPARQAARDAYAKAKDAPHTLTHEDVPALMAHLDTLTRDELREHARAAVRKLGGRKAELVQRLVGKITGEKAAAEVWDELKAPAKAFGHPGNDHPISGKTRDEQISQLAALVGKGDDGERDPMGLRKAGPPKGLDMHGFTADVQAAVDAAPNAHAGLGLEMPELYAKVGEKYGLSKHDFNRAMAAVGDSKSVRMGGWPQSLDEIPDPQLGTMTSSTLMYYAHPNPGTERLTPKAAKPSIDALPTDTPALSAHLRKLIAASDADPRHVDDAHMKRIVDHLNSLPKAQQKAAAEAALGYPVKNAKDGVERLEDKLVGVRRMMARQNV